MPRPANSTHTFKPSWSWMPDPKTATVVNLQSHILCNRPRRRCSFFGPGPCSTVFDEWHLFFPTLNLFVLALSLAESRVPSPLHLSLDSLHCDLHTDGWVHDSVAEAAWTTCIRCCLPP
jgi:hypothetical protein